MTEPTARQDISDHVDYVAAMISVGRQAAKGYVTDEVIAAVAARIAAAVDEHCTVIDLDAERRRRRGGP